MYSILGMDKSETSFVLFTAICLGSLSLVDLDVIKMISLVSTAHIEIQAGLNCHWLLSTSSLHFAIKPENEFLDFNYSCTYPTKIPVAIAKNGSSLLLKKTGFDLI